MSFETPSVWYGSIYLSSFEEQILSKSCSEKPKILLTSLKYIFSKLVIFPSASAIMKSKLRSSSNTDEFLSYRLDICFA